MKTHFRSPFQLQSTFIALLLMSVVKAFALPFDLTFESAVGSRSLPPGITTGDSIIFAIRVDNGNTSFKDQTWDVNDYISATVTLQSSTTTYTATVGDNVSLTAGSPSIFETNAAGGISQVGDWSVNSTDIIFSDSLGNDQNNSGNAGFTINETNPSPFFFVNGPASDGGSIRVSVATDTNLANWQVVSVPEEGSTLTMLGAGVIGFVLIGYVQRKRMNIN